MEVNRLFRVGSKQQKDHSIFFGSIPVFGVLQRVSGVLQAVIFQMLYCPMKHGFTCNCQIKISQTSEYVFLDMHGMHDAESHSPEKDT